MLLFAAVVLAIFWLPSPWGVVAVAAAAVVEILEAAVIVWYSRRRRPQVGVEALVGASGRVVTACRPVGQVRVHGELWRARCDAGADEGEAVHVDAVEGLTLVVARA